MLSIQLDDETLQVIADQVAKRIKAQPKADWAKLEDTRQDLFAGKSKEWIRLNIFDRFPETQMENDPVKGWVKGVHGRGQVTQIYLPKARKWLRDNHNRIDWLA